MLVRIKSINTNFYPNGTTKERIITNKTVQANNMEGYKTLVKTYSCYNIFIKDRYISRFKKIVTIED